MNGGHQGLWNLTLLERGSSGTWAM
jgi:hypothetical protein